jgi:hypothetical protein
MDNPIVYKVVGIAVGLIVAALMLPIALNQLANGTTAVAMPNVNSSVRTMLAVLVPVIAVIGIVMYFLSRD